MAHPGRVDHQAAAPTPAALETSLCVPGCQSSPWHGWSWAKLPWPRPQGQERNKTSLLGCWVSRYLGLVVGSSIAGVLEGLWPLPAAEIKPRRSALGVIMATCVAAIRIKPAFCIKKWFAPIQPAPREHRRRKGRTREGQITLSAALKDHQTSSNTYNLYNAFFSP